MSRYSDYDGDENFPNEGELWRHNVTLALRGRKGRAALADLREALLALPEKRLIARALCTVNPEKRIPEARYGLAEVTDLVAQQGEGVCAVGAFVWWSKVKAGADPVEAFDSLPTLEDTDTDLYETVRVGQDAGLSRYVAWELAYQNDETFETIDTGKTKVNDYGRVVQVRRWMTPEERYERTLAWIDEQLAKPLLTRAPRKVKV